MYLKKIECLMKHHPISQYQLLRLCFLLVMICKASTTHAYVKIGDLFYDLYTSNTAHVVSESKSQSSNYPSLTEVIIPGTVTYNGINYTVTDIDAGAFRGCQSITSITTPTSLININDSAFKGCPALKEIILPSSVEKIRDYAFENCTSLTSINIPNSVTEIGSAAFMGCKALKSITLPSSITRISDSLFMNCDSLVSIEIPNSIKSIGKEAFSGCRAIESMNIPASVTRIKHNAFRLCNFKSLRLDDGVDILELGAEYVYFSFDPTTILAMSSIFPRLETLYLGRNIDYDFYNADPNEKEDYEFYAFYGDPTLTYVTIGKYVTTLPQYTFAKCKNLVSVTMPTVTEIKEHAFSDCGNLRYLEVGKNTITHIGDYAFSNCNKLTSTDFGNEIDSIGSHAFYNCPAVQSLDLENKSVEIGAYAFYGNENLTDINITGGNIGEAAFSECSKLEQVILGDEVMSVEKEAFRGDTSLTTVSLGKAILDIRDYTFARCSSLSSIKLPEDLRGIGSSAFESCSSLATVILPKSVEGIGNHAFRWATALEALNLPENVWSIGEGAFQGSGLIAITLPENLHSIGAEAFQETGLTTITLPDGIAELPDYTFADCKDLREVTLGVNISSIGRYAFSECSALTSLSIRTNTASIGEKAFYNCTSLKSLTYGNEKKSPEFDDTVGNEFPIGEKAFDGCSALEYVDLGAGVTAIAKGAFANCTSLKHLTFWDGTEPSRLDSIAESAFINCSGLESLTFPGSLGTIGHYAFNGCTGIKALRFEDGKGILRLGYNTFDTESSSWNKSKGLFGDCALETLYLGRSIEYINYSDSLNFDAHVNYYGYSAFYNQPKLANITIGPGASSLPKCLFQDNKSITSIELPAVVEIGKYCFYHCDSLETLVLGDSLVYIGPSAFWDCKRLANVSFGNHLQIIDRNAFSDCQNLKEIILPDAVTSIGEWSFRECTSLTRAKLGSNLQTISNHAFRGCATLSEMVIPDKVKKIGEGAFYGCSNLTKMSLGTSVDSIGRFAFIGNQFSSMNIPKSVKHIGRNCFRGCTKLTHLTIEDGNTVLTLDNYNTTSDLIDSTCLYDYFYDCPIDTLYIGRNLVYSSSSSVEIYDLEQQCIISRASAPFAYKSTLRSVTLGPNLTSLPELLFVGSANIRQIKSYNPTPPEGWPDFEQNVKNEATVLVHTAAVKAYKASTSWKEFYNISSLTDAVTHITLSPESISIKENRTLRLKAIFSPDNAAIQTLRWASSDLTVATVNENGEIKAVREGTATIMAYATDGSEVRGTCLLTVIPTTLGDSNDNDEVTVADAVNTANYAMGKEVERFYFNAADVNDDGIITISDASGTISIVLDQPVAKASQSITQKLHASYGIADRLVITPQDNHSSETQTVSIELENSRNYVAIQTDLILPEGIKLIEAKTGPRAKDSHILSAREVEKGIYRLVLFSASNKPLPLGGEAIIQLTLKTNGKQQDYIELGHSLAVDAKANEYRLNYTNKPDQTPTNLDNRDSGCTSQVSIGNNGIIISSARGKQADIYTLDGKCIQSFTLTTESAFYPLPAGIYVIKIDTVTEKVLIK